MGTFHMRGWHAALAVVVSMIAMALCLAFDCLGGAICAVVALFISVVWLHDIVNERSIMNFLERIRMRLRGTYVRVSAWQALVCLSIGAMFFSAFLWIISIQQWFATPTGFATLMVVFLLFVGLPVGELWRFLCENPPSVLPGLFLFGWGTLALTWSFFASVLVLNILVSGFGAVTTILGGLILLQNLYDS